MTAITRFELTPGEVFQLLRDLKDAVKRCDGLKRSLE